MLSNNKETQMIFVCEKCKKGYASKRALVKHNEKVPFCNMAVPAIPTNNNEIVELKDIIMVLIEEIKSLREEFKSFKSPILTTNITPPFSYVVQTEQMKTNESLSYVVQTEQIKTNNIPVVEKIKKVKKVKKTPAPIKYTIVPPTTETEVDMSLSVQPVLTTIPINENPIEYLTKTYEPTDTIYGNLKYICKDLQEEWFEKCEDDYLKFYIKDDKCREFIDKCSTIEKKEAFYAILFEQHLKYNYDLGVLSFYDYKTERLYVINEDMDWELSTTNTTNPIGCLLWDKLNTAVAFTAKFNPDLANDLFKIKHLVSKNEKINEIVKSVLSTLNYDKIRVSI